MISVRVRILIVSLAGTLPLHVCADVVQADSLRAKLVKRSFLLYEPMALQVTINLEEPLVLDWEAPEEAMKQLRRLPRRVHVELRDEQGSTVSKSVLLGGEFPRPDHGSPAEEFSALGLAIFELPWDIGAEARNEPRAGNYTVVVLGRNRLESNAVAVELRIPEGADAQALRVFQSSMPEGYLLIGGQGREIGGEALDRFKELARDYPDTIYGTYAVVSLALLRYQETFAENNNKGGSAVWGPVANELAGVEPMFGGKHPLREQVLYRLATARVLSGDHAGARESLAALKATFPQGKLGRRSEQFEQQITQLEQQNRSAGNDQE